MKKGFLILLCIMVCFSAFGGGGQQSGQGPARETLSMFINGGITPTRTSFTYNDNTFVKRLVDDTGINLDISAMTAADSAARLNVMLNSGDYPDIIFERNFSIAELDYFGTQQGIFIPLEKYNIRQHKQIDDLIKAFPALDTVIRGTNGQVYGLPYANGCLHCTYRSGRAAFYMPFIRDNNLKMFETYDEMADYLRWVRDNDANRNGDRTDEIPMMWRASDTRNAIAFFAKGFMPFKMSESYFGMGLNNRRVVEQYREPEFRDTLRFIAQLYRENLIAPDSFTMTNDEGRALGYSNPNRVAVYGMTQMNAMMTTNDARWIETMIMPVLRGRGGNRYAPNYSPWQNLGVKMVVTDKCKNPEAAIRVYEAMLSLEMNQLSTIGHKGETWDDPDPGSLSISNGPPLWKQITGVVAPLNTTIISTYVGWYNEWRYGIQGFEMDKINAWLANWDPAVLDSLTRNGSYNEAHNYIESLKMTPYAMPDSDFIPPFGMSESDNSRIADIMVNFNRYLDTAMVEFITGVRNINNDADWNTFNNELDRLGATERANIIQKYMR